MFDTYIKSKVSYKSFDRWEDQFPDKVAKMALTGKKYDWQKAPMCNRCQSFYRHKCDLHNVSLNTGTGVCDKWKPEDPQNLKEE